MKTAVITALTKNDVGYLIKDLICQDGVGPSFIHWIAFDDIGHLIRNGLNVTECGFNTFKTIS